MQVSGGSSRVSQGLQESIPDGIMRSLCPPMQQATTDSSDFCSPCVPAVLNHKADCKHAYGTSTGPSWSPLSALQQSLQRWLLWRRPSAVGVCSSCARPAVCSASQSQIQADCHALPM